MLKRMVLMLVVAAAVIAGLGYFKFKQIQTAIAQGAAFQPPPEAVTTIVAKEDRWPETLSAIGTITAAQGVTVSADLPGIVETINFESGDSVKEGQILVELDTRQERAQLAAAEAARDLAKVNFERLEGLVNQRAIARADYDRAAAELKQDEAHVGEIRATIERKTIRAPFSGILGIRQVNLGQYLAGGAPVVSLQKLDPIYADFDVPQRYVPELQVGREVRLQVSDLGNANFSGRIIAIDSVVNENTRNIRIRALVNNARGILRPGMFVETEILMGAGTMLVTIPASAVNYAPYGDSVFIVEDMKGQDGRAYKGVRQQFIKVGPSRGDQVAVTSGLKPGEEVVTSGTFKLRNGAAVYVNNETQPSNQAAPKPEDS